MPETIINLNWWNMKQIYQNNPCFKFFLIILFSFVFIIINANEAFAEVRVIGDFEYGEYKGFITAQSDGSNSLLIQVSYDIKKTEQAISLTDEVSVWALLEQGRSMQLHQRMPPLGQYPIETENAGSSTAHVAFRFNQDKMDKPVAIVLKLANHYQVFPIF